MQTITLIDALKIKRKDIVSMIKKGTIFIYPTDTIYGIGCNAEIGESVWKIRNIKRSKVNPFSVIAPSKEWIKENFIIKYEEYLNRLPGSYTFILEKKNPLFLKEANRPNTLGIRMPNHPFTTLIQEAGVPFITTSANVSGKESIKQVSEIPDEIKEKIDIAIDAGILNNPPSNVFDLTGDEPKKIR